MKKKRRSLVEIKNLCLKIKGKLILNNISFSLEYNEIVGVVGESGSGKSLMAHILMGLQPKHSEIIAEKLNFLDSDLRNFSPKKWQKYRGRFQGMIFQEPQSSLNPTLKCGKQLREVLSFHQKMSLNEKKERVINTLKEVKLLDTNRIINSYPHQLSGGQKQRVMIAMALLCNPKLLIADEPTTALDVTVQKTILELMQKLQKERDMGILFITHDLGVIAELADKVVVMYKGDIVEQGNVWDIFTNPKHPYTKGLLACRPPLDKRYTFLPTVSDFMRTDDDGKIVDNNISVEDFTKDLAISEDVRNANHKKLFANDPILQIKNLKTYFPIRNGFFGGITSHVKAVDNISFDVYKGETLGLVGESGCGKTTCGRTILRLEEPTSGKIVYKGKDVSNMSSEELRLFRKEVQIIFQDPYSSLNPRMTIGNAIMEPMQVHNILKDDNERKKRVEELLSKVSLDPTHFYRYPHEFSGGQRQRIGIARSLYKDSELIIFDEATSALDSKTEKSVLDVIYNLPKTITIIIISHKITSLNRCDKVLKIETLKNIDI